METLRRVRLHWIEAAAMHLRLEMQIGERVTTETVERIADRLPELLTVNYTDERFGNYVVWPDGLIDVWIARGPRAVWSFLHELGESMLTVGLGRWMERNGEPGAKRQRIREEGIAERFARSFLLPLTMLRQYPDDYELAEAASVSVGLVRQRRRETVGMKITSR